MSPTQMADTWYFSIDSVENISADTLKLATTAAGTATGTAATYRNPGSDTALDNYLAQVAPSPNPTMTRYWWSLLLGAGQTIIPPVGVSVIYGQLGDSPNTPIYAWRVTFIA